MNRLFVAFLGGITGACLTHQAPLWLTALCILMTVAFVLGGSYAARREMRLRVAEARHEAGAAASEVARTRVQTLLDGLRLRAVPAGIRGHNASVIEQWAQMRGSERTRGYLEAVSHAQQAIKDAEL